MKKNSKLTTQEFNKLLNDNIEITINAKPTKSYYKDRRGHDRTDFEFPKLGLVIKFFPD